jgi:transcriptional regulator with XRE-family HTH domain
MTSALLRRIRRTADLSQRELAGALGVAGSTVARAETGERDLPVTVLARAAEVAGLRLGLLDADGQEVAGMSLDAVRDRAGRLFPAHLDPRHGDVWWWHGSHRYSRDRPRYTFDRDRRERDDRRATDGTPADHQRPHPGDSLAERARVREEAAAAREAERRAGVEARYLAERRLAGWPDLWSPVCSCPPGCEELLFSEEPLTPRQQAVPHLDDCTCRCDVS